MVETSSQEEQPVSSSAQPAGEQGAGNESHDAESQTNSASAEADDEESAPKAERPEEQSGEAEGAEDEDRKKDHSAGTATSKPRTAGREPQTLSGPLSELWNRLAHQLMELGELRDGFLVGAAILYGLGYLVWAVNAYDHHLGLLPALQFQYFVAGIVPAVLLGLLGLVIVSSMRWSAAIIEWLSQEDRPAGVVAVAGFLSFVALWVIDYKVVLLPVSRHHGRHQYGVFLGYPDTLSLAMRDMPLVFFGAITAGVGFVGFVVWSMERARSHHPRGELIRSRLERRALWCSALCACALTANFVLTEFLVYARVVYPKLPQEFGGVLPRPAQIDIKLDEVSPDTLGALVPSDTLLQLYPRKGEKPTLKVARTKTIEILFAGSSSLLVTPPLGDTTYELKQDAVRAIYWCNPAGRPGR